MTAAKRHEKRVGYIRVSAIDQNTERQLDGVQLDKVFTDKASGKDTAWPQLKAALDYIREGDLLLFSEKPHSPRTQPLISMRWSAG